MDMSIHAQTAFSNSEELNGAEIYRRLVTPQLSTSIIRRNAVRDKGQSPVKAKAMNSVMDAVDLWEADLLACKKAGSKEPEEDEKCAQLMTILPSNLSFEMLSNADNMGNQSSGPLIDWMRAKSTFINDHAAKEIHMFLPDSETGGISPPGCSAPFLPSGQSLRRPR